MTTALGWNQGLFLKRACQRARKLLEKIRHAFSLNRQHVEKSWREHPDISESGQNRRQEGGGSFEKPLVPLAVRLNVVPASGRYVARLKEKAQMCFLLCRQIRKNHAVLSRNEPLVRDTKRNVNRLRLVCRTRDTLFCFVVLGFKRQSFDDVIRGSGFRMQYKPFFPYGFNSANLC